MTRNHACSKKFEFYCLTSREPYPPSFLSHGGKIGVQTEQFRPMGKDKRRKQWYIAKWLETTNFKGQERKR